MDEKTHFEMQRAQPRRDRRVVPRLLVAGLITLAALAWLRTCTGPVAPFSYRSYKEWKSSGVIPVSFQSNQLEQPGSEIILEDSGGLSSKRKVPLEAHIMSKCPDAKDCLHDLVVPAMQRIHDKVDFKLSYIGRTTDRDDGVECKHGPSECLGNMIELCAAQVYPSPQMYLGFTMCLTRDYEDIPQRSLVEDCSLEHGMDFDKLNQCVSSDDGNGVALLRTSVERSANASVQISCTIRLDEKKRCVRDGGEWKDCEGGSRVDDLVRDVNKLYDAINS
ncbi:MAG: hypothetical protein M1835_003202 [Candelina submexicana]|nr:MAG: hypothetical protein M1835_003202 [Candelina submexicana]